MVQATVNRSLRPVLAIEDLSRIYHLAFKTELDRIILRQVATPMLDTAHAEANRDYARYFTLLARCAQPPHPDADTFEQLIDDGLADEEAARLHALIERHRNSLPISPNQIGSYLVEAGVYANDANKKVVGRIVAAAYRNACLAGSDRLGQPVPQGSVWPLPGNLVGLLDIEPHQHDAPTTPMTSLAATTAVFAESPKPASAEAVLPIEPPADHVSTTAMAAIAISGRIEEGAWDKDRVRDVNAAVKLFVAANGDVAFTA